MDNYKKIPEKEEICIDVIFEEKNKIDYRNKYFKLIREIKIILTQIESERCPIVKSCCGACIKLKQKLKENGN